MDVHVVQELCPVLAADVFNQFLMNAVGFLRVVVPLVFVFSDVNFMEPAILKADYDAILIAVVIDTGIRMTDVVRQILCSVTVQIPHHVVLDVLDVWQQLMVVLVESILKQVKTELPCLRITAWNHLIIPIEIEALGAEPVQQVESVSGWRPAESRTFQLGCVVQLLYTRHAHICCFCKRAIRNHGDLHSLICSAFFLSL